MPGNKKDKGTWNRGGGGALILAVVCNDVTCDHSQKNHSTREQKNKKLK